MAFRIDLLPNKVLLTPVAGGDPTADARPVGDTRAPPKGSFPVVTSIELRLRTDGRGGDPIQKTETKDATITFFARIKSAKPDPFTALGVLEGSVDFDTSGKKPLPRFTAKINDVKDPKPPGATVTPTHQEIAFTPAKTVEVSRSDWVIQLQPGGDGSSVISSGPGPLFLTLPWLFDIKQPTLEISASLSVAGAVVASETVNTPLQFPLEHKKVPEDLAKGGAPLSVFGVRTLSPASLERTGSALNGAAVNVYLDKPLTDFATAQNAAVKIADIAAGVRTILGDIGFSAINIAMDGSSNFTAEQTRFTTNFKNTNGRFHAANLTNVNAPSTAPNVASKRTFLGDGTIIDGEGALLPFFDFFVALEMRDMTTPELGHGETFGVGRPNQVAAGQKLIGSPVIIAGGASSTTGMRGMLDKVDPADHANLFANVITHEICHGMGLKHVVTFIDTPPYTDKDPKHFTDSIMYITALTQPLPGASTGKPRVRLNFVGPVQRQTLRLAFSIP